MLHRIKIPKRASAHQIEIFVERIEQLFNSMDPSPFHEKDLDHDAEEFIVSWAQEFPRHDPVSLIVHVKQAHEPVSEIVTEAVHHYFDYRAKLNRLELHHLLQQGRTSLLIGLAFLGACGEPPEPPTTAPPSSNADSTSSSPGSPPPCPRQAKPARPRQHGTPPADPPFRRPDHE